MPGVPWWAALLIAVSATAVGFAIDAGSGHKDLTHVFAGFYIAGCVVAVLAVRQDGVFTAVIQPPLIVFCAVPGAYWMFHGRKVGHLKDLLINCGYPLIERFPLMLGTAGGVLLIGLVRWYFGASNRTTVATAKGSSDTTTDAEDGSFASGIVAKLRSLLSRDPGDEAADGASEVDAKRERVARRAEKARQTARARSTTRAARTHSRHGRPSLDDVPESETERPRRSNRKSPGGPRDFDPAEPPRRSRRPRPQADPERGQPRGEPRTRRSPYERPTPRSSRFEGYDRYDPPVPPEQFNRYERYEPYESYEPPRRRAAPRGTNGADPTHHPISQVRYRGAPPRDEPRAERPSRSRTPGRSRGRPPAESWEYDA
ncbi:MAG: hypothetical protein QOC58_2829 [Mycobacterium sp.]|jgi:hypothetical protein|nr:hypothetical protein [Mycobacterium sp.]